MTTEEARQRKLAWYRQRYQVIQSDPERRARLLAQKAEERARRRAKAKNALPLPPAINADIYRAHGPWAPLFVIQQEAA